MSRCSNSNYLSEIAEPTARAAPPSAAAAAGAPSHGCRAPPPSQVDSRSLLGAYVCGRAAGEFVWQPGVVTQAVVQGRWLLLEDVDRAPLEVMSALAPLLERNVLYVPGRATTLRAHAAFRLWGTVTLHGRATPAVSAAADAAVYRSSLWQHVVVPALPRGDLAKIVSARYPRVAPAAPALVKAFELIVAASGGRAAEGAEGTAQGADRGVRTAYGVGAGGAIASDASGGDLGGDLGDGLAEIAERELSSLRFALGAGRAFSPRELLKWSCRISANIGPSGAILPEAGTPSAFLARRDHHFLTWQPPSS